MKHQNISITTDNGTDVLAQAPIIISASRATDIPAFYSDWFFRRLEKGYIRWRNPFSGQDSYVSFVNTRFIVFWSKNPSPLLPYLPMLEDRGIGYYIQFTLNNYEPDGLEPNVPPLAQRIDTFRRLVDTLGSGGVVWRFDPLILTDKINIDTLLEKIAHIADALVGHAEKLVFSFADINTYKKVSRNLRLSGINYREWDEESMREFALYNPQNEACNASRTKRAKNKTKREAQTKRSVPSVRFFITAATLPFFKKFSPDFAGVCGLTPARLRLSPAPLHYI